MVTFQLISPTIVGARRRVRRVPRRFELLSKAEDFASSPGRRSKPILAGSMSGSTFIEQKNSVTCVQSTRSMAAQTFAQNFWERVYEYMTPMSSKIQTVVNTDELQNSSWVNNKVLCQLQAAW